MTNFARVNILYTPARYLYAVCHLIYKLLISLQQILPICRLRMQISHTTVQLVCLMGKLSHRLLNKLNKYCLLRLSGRHSSLICELFSSIHWINGCISRSLLMNPNQTQIQPYFYLFI